MNKKIKGLLDTDSHKNHQIALGLALGGHERMDLVFSYTLKDFKHFCRWMDKVFIQKRSHIVFGQLLGSMGINGDGRPFGYYINWKYNVPKHAFTIDIKFDLEATIEVKVEDNERHKFYGCVYDNHKKGIVLHVEEKLSPMEVFYEIEEFHKNYLTK